MGESGKGGSNVQDAHEAIRPMYQRLRMQVRIQMKKIVSTNLVEVCCQPNVQFHQRKEGLKFSCDGVEVPITGTASWRTHDGWESVFSWSIGEVQTKPPEVGFLTGESWDIDSSAEMTVDFTKPPRRFTESSIIQEMKKSGIGRPSTYVSMVKTLELKRYIEKDGSSLIPTKTVEPCG